MKKEKTSVICKSCGGPVKDFPDKKVINPEFCPYCVDEQGELLGYKEILDSMIDYIKSDHAEIPNSKIIDTAQKWLGETPVWKDKFVHKHILIEDVREQNIKDIPNMDRKKRYDCSKCMFFMKNKKGDKTATDKKEWFKKMEEEYGSCGKILYYKGIPVGFAQFAPKKEFIKLEDYSTNCTKTDAWFICCIAILKKYQSKGFGSLLLNLVLADLKRRNVKKVHGRGQVKGNAQGFPSGYWSMYEKHGFKKIGEGENVIVGELILKNLKIKDLK